MKKKFIYFIGAALTLFSLNSCDLDINKDPNAVTALDVAQLLTATEYEVAATFSEGYYLNANFSSYVHHTVSREVDNYSLISSYSTLENTWGQAYRYAVKNCDKLIVEGDAAGNSYYAGIGRVLRTYTYLAMTDLWGNIPYSEANVDGIQFPKADSSESIYNSLLASLNTAVANFKDTESANELPLGSNDLFYGGNVEKWIKAANTLKLKLLVQSRPAKDKITGWDAELASLLTENNFMSDGEDLQFPHSTAIAPMDERKFGFVDEYEGSQKSCFISPWLYEVMNGKTTNFKNNPLMGVKDPRTNYYYCNQLTADAAAANPVDYRDGAFVSIMFGSNSGNASHSHENAMTVLGIYPIGGKYDDGKGGKISAKSGNGVAPDKMLQAYSVPFMLAELALAGEYAGDAAELLKEGMLSSIYHVNAVASKSDPNCPLISSETATEFADAVLAKYNAADANGKLEIIMTQKWIANFYNPVEAYTDIRRTGYPQLFKGDDGYAYSPFAQTAEPVSGTTRFNIVTLLEFPRTLWYPMSETNVNPNLTNEGRVLAEKVLFWDVK